MDTVIPESLLPTLVAGLNLRDRVAAGDRPHLGSEQAKFKAMLAGIDQSIGHAGQSMSLGETNSSDYLGMKYAIVCWLDEIMIDAGWREWDENKLEMSLYQSNRRYGNFWQQARVADADPRGVHDQAAFLLSALLGFRGELGEQPEKFREWVSLSRGRITKSLGREPAALPEKTPISDVPPLTGIDSYRAMTRRLVAGILFAIPVLAFLVLVLLRK